VQIWILTAAKKAKTAERKPSGFSISCLGASIAALGEARARRRYASTTSSQQRRIKPQDAALAD